MPDRTPPTTTTTDKTAEEVLAEAKAYAQLLWDTQRVQLIAELNASIDRQVKWPFLAINLAPLLFSLGRITAAERDLLVGDWHAYTVTTTTTTGPDGSQNTETTTTQLGFKPEVMTLLLKMKALAEQ